MLILFNIQVTTLIIVAYYSKYVYGKNINWHSSSGRPHLGNILGAIAPGVELSKNDKNDSLFFIADLHSLTTIKDADVRKQNINATAAAWLAFGFDTKKNIFYRQSQIPEVCEMTGI